MWTFWARTDSNNANNPALNLTGDPATKITFVEFGTNGDLILDTNGGAPDPDTQVNFGGVLFDFTFELSADLPTLARDGAQQVPDQFEGSAVFIISVQGYPSAGETTRLTFLPDETATQAEMDAFGNGAIDLQNTGTEPAPDYIVEGTNAADIIDANYQGDLEGDRVDNNDGNPLQPGAAGGDNDSIAAGDGNDTISAGAGSDTIDAGTGDDIVFGSDGLDSILGGAGNDTITIDQGDTAQGGDGDDFFTLADVDTTGTGNAAMDITGGEGSETNGDTLQLTSDVTQADITFTNTDDTAGGLSGSFTMADGTVVTFSEIENIICFTPGTQVLTQYGERPIETLRVGDMVVTRDHGLRPIRWIGRRTVPGTGRLAPIAIDPGVMDGSRTGLLVSPQHRMLFTGYRAELLFGDSEVLVPARYLVNGQDVREQEQPQVAYIHIMFDRHEVIYAEGIATESFYAGDEGLSAIGAPAREELFTIFPELRSAAGQHRETARTCLKIHEAKMLGDETGQEAWAV